MPSGLVDQRKIAPLAWGRPRVQIPTSPLSLVSAANSDIFPSIRGEKNEKIVVFLHHRDYETAWFLWKKIERYHFNIYFLILL
jgi:hypothetical protein